MKAHLYLAVAYAWLVTFLLFTSSHSEASPDLLENSSHCQILFSLDGSSQALFEQQVQHLSQHIKRLDIELLDLNKPHTAPSYQTLSGRKRRQIKQWLGLVDDKSTAVIMLNQLIIFQSSGNIDLTLLLETCQQHTE